MTDVTFPEKRLVECLSVHGEAGLDCGNLWLASFRELTGIQCIVLDGIRIQLPIEENGGFNGRLDDPLLVTCAIWGATQADPQSAEEIQTAIEDVSGRGVVALITACIAATATIVGGALGVVASKKNAKAAKAAKEAEEKRLEAERVKAAAELEAAEKKKQQTVILVCGLGCFSLVGIALWSRLK